MEFWIVFHLVVLGMLALDLGVLNRRAHVPSVREAALWSAAWVVLALLFNAWVWIGRGSEDGLRFFTGYLIEKSLSVDNIFVFLVVFGALGVPAALRPRVLKWGVLGALVMRAALIFSGAALIERFAWVLYLFGAFLVLTGVRLVAHRDEEVRPERNRVLGLLRRRLRVTGGYEGGAFFVRRQRLLHATPLLLALVLVEVTDLVFAVDSIPAVFAVTTDPFLVYTSNIFAILGLRALFFLLAGAIGAFRYLKVGLGAVLMFVGVKMLLADVTTVPLLISLSVIAAILAASIAASVLRPRAWRSAPRSSLTTADVPRGEQL